MKKIIASVFALSLLSFANAQDQSAKTSNPPLPGKVMKATPEQIATRQSMHLQKMLGLSEDQKQKTYQAVLTRTSAVQAVHAKYGPDGDKKAMHGEVKPIKEQFVQTMNGVLTPEQKTKWEEHRLKFKQRRMQNKEGKQGPPPPAGANADPKKLMGDDDGIDD